MVQIATLEGLHLLLLLHPDPDIADQAFFSVKSLLKDTLYGDVAVSVLRVLRESSINLDKEIVTSLNIESIFMKFPVNFNDIQRLYSFIYTRAPIQAGDILDWPLVVGGRLYRVTSRGSSGVLKRREG